MKIKSFFILLLLFITAALIFTGCFFNKKIAGAIPGLEPGGKDLKKRIAVIFKDNGSKNDIQNILYKVKESFLPEVADESDDIIVLRDEKGDIASEFLNLPVLYSNNYDNLFLVPTGRRIGLDAAVFISADIVSRRKAVGYFMFKKHVNFSVVEIKATVYDMETGAKLLDKVFAEEVEREYDDFIDIADEENKIDFSEYEEVIIDIAEDAAEEVCEAIEAEEWKGYIIKRDKDKAIISAGNQAGLTEGDIFNIYNSGSTVKSADTQHFFIPGKKIGTLQVTVAEQEASRAIILSGEGNISAGNIVKYAK
ncbi:MAG: hypothetical protein JRJ49_03100 [Deltaproteobacteria bacterium]|nr:hypothetical protein [Deltaproteobacteria bacterium]